MRKIISDIRALWLVVPVAGNAMALLLLAVPFFSARRKDPLPLELRMFVTTALLFVAYFTLRGLIALPDPGLGGALSRISPIAFIAGLVLIFQLRIDGLSLGKWPAHVAIGLLVASLLEFLFIPDGQRVELLAGNPIFFSSAILSLAYLNLWCGWRGPARNRWMHHAGFLSVLLILGLFGGGRGPWLAVTLSMGLHGICVVVDQAETWRTRVSHLGRVALCYLLGCLSLVLGPFAYRFASFVETAVSRPEVGNMEQSISLRLQMWIASFEALRDSPWFGYGPQNRFSALLPYVENPDAFPVFSHPHNFVFTYGNAGGLVGILLGLALIFSTLTGRFLSRGRSTTSVELLLQGAFVTCFTGVTGYVLFEGYMAIVTCFMLIAPCCFVQKTGQETPA